MQVDNKSYSGNYSELLPLIKNRNCRKILEDKNLFFLCYIYSDFRFENACMLTDRLPLVKFTVFDRDHSPITETVQKAQAASEKLRAAFIKISGKINFTINDYSIRFNDTIVFHDEIKSYTSSYPHHLARNLIRLAAFCGFECSVQGIHKENNCSDLKISDSSSTWYQFHQCITIKGTITPVDRRVLKLYQNSLNNVGCHHTIEASDGTKFHLHTDIYPKKLPSKLAASAELVSAYVKFLYLGEKGFLEAPDHINCDTCSEFDTFCSTYKLDEFSYIARKYTYGSEHSWDYNLFGPRGALKIASSKI